MIPTSIALWTTTAVSDASNLIPKLLQPRPISETEREPMVRCFKTRSSDGGGREPARAEWGRKPPIAEADGGDGEGADGAVLHMPTPFSLACPGHETPLPPTPSPCRGRGSARFWLFTFPRSPYRVRMNEERGFIGPNHTWPAKRERARQLRQDATPAEKRAWQLLRGYRRVGCCFRRQQVIDGFIVDFFCAHLRLVIELDGAVHLDPDVRKKDKARDEHLTSLGLTVIRIPNEDTTAQKLDEIVSTAMSARTSPLPRQGEGDRG